MIKLIPNYQYEKGFSMNRPHKIYCLVMLLSLCFYALSLSISFSETHHPETIDKSIQFTGQGCVDSISIKNKSISIDDRQFKYVSETCLHLSPQKTVSIYILKPGDRVGYICFNDSKNTLKSLWLIDKLGRDK
jgi:hypothetical protein